MLSLKSWAQWLLKTLVSYYYFFGVILKRFAIGAVAASLLLLGACSSDGDASSKSSDFENVQGATTTGAFGEVPTVAFDGDPSADLQRTVISTGDGDSIEKGDLVITDYAGFIFDGAEFGTSFDENVPVAFNQGAGHVVPGWEKTLEGLKEGSRVVISVPSNEGYGEEGSSAVGIGADDTLVFVVDILAVLDPDASGQADAEVADAPPAGVNVSGDLGGAATLSVEEGAAIPSADSFTLLAKGTGEPLVAGTAVVQFASSTWDASEKDNTWENSGPQPITVGDTHTILDSLIGVPIGSRVVMVMAPYEEDTEPAATTVVVVLDVLGQPMGVDEPSGAALETPLDDDHSSEEIPVP